MNIDSLKFWNNLTLEYFTTLSADNFMPFISAPTRITDITSTLIDHIFVKLNDKDRHASVLAGNILTDISDHLPIFYYLMVHHGQIRIIDLLWGYSQKKTLKKFKESLLEIDWTELLRGQSATEMCNILYYHVNNLFSSTFPLIRLSRKRIKDKKRITSALRQCILKKKYPVQETMAETHKHKTLQNLP